MDAEYELALDRFCSKDSSTAEDGFDKLIALERAAALGHLRRFVSASDAEIVFHDATTEIWSKREKYENRGLARWKRYFRNRVTWSLLKFIGERIETTDDNPEEGGPDKSLFEIIIEAVSDAELLDMLIGEAFFGYRPQVSLTERNQRVTAARLLVLDGLPLDEVCRSVLPQTPLQKARDQVRAWIDTATLLDLAHRVIYWRGHPLCCHLLQVSPESTPEPLRVQKPPVSQAWAPMEVEIIICRYYNGLSIVRTEAQTGATSKEISRLDDRCRVMFPFIKSVNDLSSRLISRPKLLITPNLWFRIAFEYGYRDELSQKDILARMEDAGTAAGYPIKASQLNVWFGNHRLIKKVTDAWMDRKGK